MKEYKGKNWKLYNGNMLDMLNEIDPCSIDSIVTDPPYELNFMNKGWDNSGIAFRKETWEKCFEVLKPGGYLLAFGGSRTFHRIAVAIEDAGFEIRDTIMWLYGSGFPKSMNIGLAIDKKQGLQGQRGIGGFNVSGLGEQGNRSAKLYIGSTTDGSKQKAYDEYKSDDAKLYAGWGTALKPAYEPIIVARKPCEGTCVDNVLKWGVGGINIDECRVGTDPIVTNGARKNAMRGDSRTGKALGMFQEADAIMSEHTGRFPANTILTYDETDFDEVCGGLPIKTTPNGSITNPNLKNSLGNNGIYGKYSEMQPMWESYGDSGSAARYFYCAKASKRDRDEGLEEFEDKVLAYSNQAQAELKRGNPDDGERKGMNRPVTRKNTHPTVKPTSLMQYLVRLVTPKGGTVLDPFNGSGSTGKAVMYENKDREADYKYIGIELTEEYIPIAMARIEYAVGEEEHEEEAEVSQFTIFDYIAK